ncbi:MAG: penicillin-binding protein [Bacillus sp. (in: firmicutes)]
MQGKKKNMNRGAALLFVFFSLLFFMLIGRFLYIQITGQVDGQVLAAKAQAKTLKEEAIEATRGSIIDRNGEIIAEDSTSYTIVAILDESQEEYVEDAEETAEQLAKYLEMDEEDIRARLQKTGKFQVEFGSAGKNLSNTVKRQIEALNLPGITFTKETKRFYPNGIFASHVIGYADSVYNEETEENEYIGMLGLEKMLNENLTGVDGSVNYNSDRWGILLPNSEESITAPKDGDSVQLTLDKKIQTFLEDALNKVEDEYNPAKLIAIVADPKTGEILAMGQRPSFNPSTREGLTATWKNLAIEENFEPGSTMKVFTLAAAVEEGVFQPNATFVAGKYQIGGRTINDHSGITKGEVLTYLQGVQQSSNVAFVKIALEQLGTEKLREYLTAFGLDEKTGIDLPNEVGSTILYNAEIEKATTAFGQGSVITPIQQIQAFTAIANEGKMMKPYVIDQIIDSSGEVVEDTEPTVVSEPISASTAKKVLEYLETVVSDEDGTGQRYAIEGYKVAGKTGTAQIAGENGQYLTGYTDYMYSFIGAVPADDPQLIMYVAMQQPTLPSGKTAADGMSSIFKSVIKNSLQYLNIESTETTTKEVTAIGDYTGVSVEKAQTELTQLGYEVVMLGEGATVIAQAPIADTSLIQGEKIILMTDGAVKMPNLEGWSLRDVMKVVNLVGLDLNVTGNGYVKAQNIAEGTEITEGEYLVIELQTPEESLQPDDNEDEEVGG